MKPFTSSIHQCASFNHALATRIILEGAGFPAIAATITRTRDGTTHHALVALAPPVALETALDIGEMFSIFGDAGLRTVRSMVSAMPESPVTAVISADIRDGARGELMDKLINACTASGSVITLSDPAVPTPPTDGAPSAEVLDTPTTPVHNPDGGGWDSRCTDEHGKEWDRAEYRAAHPLD